MSPTLQEAIIREIEALPEERHCDVLKAVRGLRGDVLKGVPGMALLPSFGAISEADAAEMEREIEEQCERVEPDAW